VRSHDEKRCEQQDTKEKPYVADVMSLVGSKKHLRTPPFVERHRNAEALYQGVSNSQKQQYSAKTKGQVDQLLNCLRKYESEWFA
jgi:hypothetical protein